ncbi:MAG: putative glycolipid-binding domain-containing protein [Alphaproteobacteria bacterium]|nr:putative glycolipid-binding domain-containing protein [Alphaproteobacteria bacterium]
MNQTLMWRRILDEASFEQASVRMDPDGIEIAGTALLAEAGAPLRIDYRLTCDAGWITRRVEATQSFQGRTRTLTLDHDGQGQWRRDGTPAPQLDGCLDVDLGISPATNALPINRLRLAVGETREIRAAWVLFPEFAVKPAAQSYERLGEGLYRYRGLDSDFQAEVAVDEAGFPTDYGTIWRRIATGPATRNVQQVTAEALLSPAASPVLGEAAHAFDWVIGGWRAEVTDFAEGVPVASDIGEWWFSWALDGRAIQDVWIAPARGRRQDIRIADRYSTTLRFYDAGAGLWRIIWINPVTGTVNRLAGTRQGDRILLEGEEYGSPARWSFNDIRPDSFVWRGEIQKPDGSWRLDAEFRLVRVMG